MNATEILDQLRAEGISIEPRPGGRLYLEPKSKLTPALTERIRACKADLLAHLCTQQEHAGARRALTQGHGHRQSGVHRRRCRCGYHVYDAERIFCPQCGLELPQPAPANREAEGDRSARAEEQRETDRLARADGWKPLLTVSRPAYSIVETCQCYGVSLRIDSATGDVIVGRAGAKADEATQPWPSLLHAVKHHPKITPIHHLKLPPLV